MKFISKLLVSQVVLLGACSLGLGADHPYIGAKKCGKFCHKVEYRSWLKSKHAVAFNTLKPEEQKDPKCYGCHVTNHDLAMPGVQCEQCHGAGGSYKSLKVMKDPAAARAAGLIVPTEKLCVQCHNAKSPHFKEFNFAERSKKVHDVKKKKKA